MLNALSSINNIISGTKLAIPTHKPFKGFVLIQESNSSRIKDANEKINYSQYNLLEINLAGGSCISISLSSK